MKYETEDMFAELDEDIPFHAGKPPPPKSFSPRPKTKSRRPKTIDVSDLHKEAFKKATND